MTWREKITRFIGRFLFRISWGCKRCFNHEVADLAEALNLVESLGGKGSVCGCSLAALETLPEALDNETLKYIIDHVCFYGGFRDKQAATITLDRICGTHADVIAFELLRLNKEAVSLGLPPILTGNKSRAALLRRAKRGED